MASVAKPPVPVEVLGPGKVRTHCQKCGEAIVLEFGDMTREEAEAVVKQVDDGPRECPGYHVELTGWRRLWQMDEAIKALYGPA